MWSPESPARASVWVGASPGSRAVESCLPSRCQKRTAAKVTKQRSAAPPHATASIVASADCCLPLVLIADRGEAAPSRGGDCGICADLGGGQSDCGGDAACGDDGGGGEGVPATFHMTSGGSSIETVVPACTESDSMKPSWFTVSTISVSLNELSMRTRMSIVTF